MYNPSIYSASKIWHAPKWVDLRDNHGYNIIARWINIPCGTPDDPTGAKLLTPAEKRQLWLNCQHDTVTADMTVVYAEKNNEQRGALVEMGMALGSALASNTPKPIYVIGTCPSFEVAGHSDVAFMHHPLVHRLKNVMPNLDGSYNHFDGYRQAKEHFLTNYYTPELAFKKTPFLQSNFMRVEP